MTNNPVWLRGEEKERCFKFHIPHLMSAEEMAQIISLSMDESGTYFGEKWTRASVIDYVKYHLKSYGDHDKDVVGNMSCEGDGTDDSVALAREVVRKLFPELDMGRIRVDGEGA